MQADITPAPPERLAMLASLLGRGFVVEPMMRWSLGDHGDVAERFTRCFQSLLEPLIGLGMVWEAGNAAGAAVWIPPDYADAWVSAQSTSAIRALTQDGGRRYDEFWAWVESKMPDEPVWHLDSVAVEPGSRRTGIGKALMHVGLMHARADHVAAVLETGNRGNVAYYERFGYRIVEELDAPGGGPPIWFMRRDP